MWGFSLFFGGVEEKGKVIMAKVIDMLKCYIEALMFFPKEQIYEAVWKADPEHCGAAVANVVYSLRRKIGDGYIETVVGSGYRFVG